MKPEAVLRWAARAWGLASTLLILAFVFGGREHVRLTASEALGFLLFPVGVIAGFAVAWRREGVGGLITLGSLALFYAWMFARDGRFPAGPYFLLLAAPGFLHVAGALIAGHERRGAAIARPVGSPGGPGERAA